MLHAKASRTRKRKTPHVESPEKTDRSVVETQDTNEELDEAGDKKRVRWNREIHERERSGDGDGDGEDGDEDEDEGSVELEQVCVPPV